MPCHLTVPWSTGTSDIPLPAFFLFTPNVSFALLELYAFVYVHMKGTSADCR